MAASGNDGLDGRGGNDLLVGGSGKPDALEGGRGTNLATVAGMHKINGGFGNEVISVAAATTASSPSAVAGEIIVDRGPGNDRVIADRSDKLDRERNGLSKYPG